MEITLKELREILSDVNVRQEGNNSVGKHCAIRAYGAGCFVGKVVSVIPTSQGRARVVLDDCIRLHLWMANSMSEVATQGVTDPERCKFSKKTEGHTILGVIEIIPCTDTALRNLYAVERSGKNSGWGK